MKIVISIFVFILIGSISFAQTHLIDSVSKLLKKDKTDTNKVLHYVDLALWYSTIDPDSAFYFSEQAELLANQLQWKKGIAASLNIRGVIYQRTDQPFEALRTLNKALRICTEPELNKIKAGVYTNFGNVYIKLGNEDKTLDYYLKALKIYEAINFKKGIANVTGNLANVWSDIKEFKEAEKLNLRAIEFFKELKDDMGLANTYTNYASDLHKTKRLTEAIEYGLMALELKLKLGNKRGAAASYHNLASIYIDYDNFKKTKEYVDKAIALNTEIGNVHFLANNYSLLANYYELNNEPLKQEQSLFKTIELSKEIGAIYIMSQAYNKLSRLYNNTQRPQLAYNALNNYIALNDSMLNNQHQDEMARKDAEFEFQQKEIENIAEQKKKDALTEAKIKTERNIIVVISISLSATIILLIFIWKALRKNKESNLVITNQVKEISGQKDLLEIKNQEINESITYAQSIQSSLLLSEEELKELFPDSFLVFMPKDKVSGDFYWAHQINESEKIIVIADCTGHGVPGGFMSMLGISFLNEIIIDKKIEEPGTVLNLLRKRVIDTLKQKGEGLHKDGMDLALLKINSKSKQITYASANSNFIILKASGELYEYKSQKMPIGFMENVSDFISNQTTFDSGDLIVLSTDGYADQFGGTGYKKYKTSRFMNLLKEEVNSDLIHLKNIIINEHIVWKGTNDQIDDITVLGIKI